MSGFSSNVASSAKKTADAFKLPRAMPGSAGDATSGAREDALEQVFVRPFWVGVVRRRGGVQGPLFGPSRVKASTSVEFANAECFFRAVLLARRQDSE